MGGGENGPDCQCPWIRDAVLAVYRLLNMLLPNNIEATESGIYGQGFDAMFIASVLQADLYGRPSGPLG